MITTVYNKSKSDSAAYAVPRLKADMLSFDGLAGTIDLADAQKRHKRVLRVTMDREGVIAVDMPVNYWLIAEVKIPAPAYASTGTGPEEEPTEQIQEPLSEQEVIVTVWPLPKERES